MATKVLPMGSTSEDLQKEIDNAEFGDIIHILGDVPFTTTVKVPVYSEITLRSSNELPFAMVQYVPSLRHFEIDGSLVLENIVLDGKTIGGGVSINQGAFAMLDKAVIQNCHSQIGGGVYMAKGVFSFYGGEIIKNTAKEGGGIYMNQGYLNMSAPSGVIGENMADLGGGVYVKNGTYRLSSGNILENKANQGGGLYLYEATLNMTRGTFEGNKATHCGGGMFISSRSSADIIGPKAYFVNNIALEGDGGGVYSEDLNNMTTTQGVSFQCNRSYKAHMSPDDAYTKYPNIEFFQCTVMEHPLNNHDINYAVSQPVTISHNIYYDSNGGLGRYVGPDMEPCETDVIATAEETSIIKFKHNFTNWNTQPDGSGIPYVPGEKINLTDDMILYAQWKRVKN